MFSSQNFILPVSSGDKVIKIRNVNGQLAHIIRDPTCTIRQEGIILTLKQQSESQVINLDFSTTTEARIAHTMLRTALLVLYDTIKNENSNGGAVEQTEFIFNPASNSTLGVNFDMVINIVATTIHNFYVNGLYVDSDKYSYTPSVGTTTIRWKSNAEYILETTDQIVIKYS